MTIPSDDTILSGPCNLVTGALGFVGAHLMRSLTLAGIPAVGVGRHDERFPPPAVCGEFELAGPAHANLQGALRYTGPKGDFLYLPLALEDAQGVERLIDRLRPSMIYHLAAQSSAAVSFREPADTFTSNVTGTLNLLEAVRRLPEAERPIVLSVGSAEEYGPQDGTGPIGEDAPLRPLSPYGVSKAAQTLLGAQYARSWDLPILLVRSFSHTGPGQDTRFALPSFARQIAAAEADRGPDTLAVGDLSAVRDFLDVRDVVDAYRQLMKEGRPGEIYNVSSGSPLTIREGLEILLQTSDREFAITRDPARCRPSDIPYLVGDSSKLRRDTGWEPRHTIEQTLADVLATARKEFS